MQKSRESSVSVRANQLELLDMVLPAFAPAYPEATPEQLVDVLSVSTRGGEKFMAEWREKRMPALEAWLAEQGTPPPHDGRGA